MFTYFTSYKKYDETKKYINFNGEIFENFIKFHHLVRYFY